MGETYVTVAGRWVWLYRAIDQYGQVIDVLVSEKRNHLLGAKVQFLTKMLVIEITSPVMHRTREPTLYNVPLLNFGGMQDQSAG